MATFLADFGDRGTNLLKDGKLKECLKSGITTESSRSRAAHDEFSGFIGGREPVAYHANMGAHPDLYNHLFGAVGIHLRLLL
jgi:hypothetical protein